MKSPVSHDLTNWQKGHMLVNFAHIHICSKFVCCMGYPFSKIEKLGLNSLFVVPTVEFRLKAGWAS